MTNKDTILTHGDMQLYVLEEVIVQERVFLLVAEVDQVAEDISDNIFIVEKSYSANNEILIRQVNDQPTLLILNPMFERLVESKTEGVK